MELVAITSVGVGVLGFLAFDTNHKITAIRSTATSASTEVDDRFARVKVIQLQMFVMGCVAWPLLALTVMRAEWDSGILVRSPLLWAITAWVLLLLLMDIALVTSTPADSLESIAEQQREVKSTFLSVVGSVFAFGMLLSILNPNADGARNKRAAQIGVTGLLLGLAFAIPVLETNRDSMLTFILTGVMKIVCLMAVAIFMSGVVVELVTPA